VCVCVCVYVCMRESVCVRVLSPTHQAFFCVYVFGVCVFFILCSCRFSLSRRVRSQLQQRAENGEELTEQETFVTEVRGTSGLRVVVDAGRLF
jgi:hypothetical protein